MNIPCFIQDRSNLPSPGREPRGVWAPGGVEGELRLGAGGVAIREGVLAAVDGHIHGRKPRGGAAKAGRSGRVVYYAIPDAFKTRGLSGDLSRHGDLPSLI